MEVLLESCFQQGEKVVLCIDSNKDMSSGKIETMLRNKFGMKDAVKSRSNKEGPKKFVRGRHQLDEIWISEDIAFNHACFLPFYFRIGDHRAILMDIPLSLIAGVTEYEIVSPAIRRLRCKNQDAKKTIHTYSGKICHKTQNKTKTAISKGPA